MNKKIYTKYKIETRKWVNLSIKIVISGINNERGE